MENESPPDSPKPDSQNQDRPGGLASFWTELKRRRVLQVTGVYAAVGWVIMQVGDTVAPYLGIADWVMSALIILIILGFPVAMVLAWIYQITPDGIQETDTEDGDGDSGVGTRKPKHSLPLLLAAAALPTVLFGALAIYFYFQSDSSSRDPHHTSQQINPLEKSIAVLPLDNLSPDPDNAFFADGVHEDILTNLSKINDLLVISRSSTLRYRDPDRNMKQIGEELGVRYLLEGSVRRASNDVRVTVQLIDTHTDGHIWADTYDRSLDNIFAIQSDIAKSIADRLQAAISPKEIAQIDYQPTDNIEAYDLLLKFREFRANNSGRGDEKIAMLEKVLEVDPDYAEAWARLVDRMHLPLGRWKISQ